MIELSSFKCDTYEMQEYRVTEICGISVTLVASVMGSGSWGNGPVWRPKRGTTPEYLPTTALDEHFVDLFWGKPSIK